MNKCYKHIEKHLRKFERLLEQDKQLEGAQYLYEEIITVLWKLNCKEEIINLIQRVYITPGKIGVSNAERKRLNASLNPYDIYLGNDLIALYRQDGEFELCNSIIQELYEEHLRKKARIDTLFILLINLSIHFDAFKSGLGKSLQLIEAAERAANFSGHPKAQFAYFDQMMRLYVGTGLDNWQKAREAYGKISQIHKVLLEEQSNSSKDLQRNVVKKIHKWLLRSLNSNSLTPEEKYQQIRADFLETAEGFRLGVAESQIFRRAELTVKEIEFKHQRNKSQFKLIQSEAFIQKGEFKQAYKTLEDLNPNDLDQHVVDVQKAYILAQLGHTSDSLELLKQSVDLPNAIITNPHIIYVRAAQTYLELARCSGDVKEKAEYLDIAKRHAEEGYQSAWATPEFHWIYWLDLVNKVITDLSGEGVVYKIDTKTLERQLLLEGNNFPDIDIDEINKWIDEIKSAYGNSMNH